MSATLELYVQPGAKKTMFSGLHGGVPKLKVAAPPVDGAANEEVIRFIAESFELPRSAVRVKIGSTSRNKVVECDGITAEDIARTLEKLGVLS